MLLKPFEKESNGMRRKKRGKVETKPVLEKV
jgi:hypothetical protein